VIRYDTILFCDGKSKHREREILKARISKMAERRQKSDKILFCDGKSKHERGRL
jgi:hypothetical protein